MKTNIEKLKRIMARKKISKRKLAVLAGISRQTIYNIIDNPDYISARLEKIAAVLGVTSKSLVE